MEDKGFVAAETNINAKGCVERTAALLSRGWEVDVKRTEKVVKRTVYGNGKTAHKDSKSKLCSESAVGQEKVIG